MEALPTIAEALRDASAMLHENGVADAQLVAQSLLAAALHSDRTYLIINFQQKLTAEQLTVISGLLERRAAGEPLQYITGVQEFFGFEFEVTPSVLIPRPESELIVEEVIRLSRDAAQPKVIDVGTGSGCLAVAIAREIETASVTAIDISADAIEVARRNAKRHAVEDRVHFLQGDLLSPVESSVRVDFIVSNPPYVAMSEMDELQREVRDWEPRIALTDSGDGLSFFRRLLAEAPRYLMDGGYLLCEMGHSQSDQVREMVDKSVWDDDHVVADIQGIPRCLVLKRRLAP
jgi:release factor glutamine methyltransferase